MTDNGSPADANAASGPADEFPSKLRVHALARILGLTSRQVLTHLAELGWHTRSPQSSIDRETAVAVAGRVRGQTLPDMPESAASVPAVGEPTAAAEPVTPPRPEPVPVPEPTPEAGPPAPAVAPVLFSAAEPVIPEPVPVPEPVEAGPLFLQPQPPAVFVEPPAPPTIVVPA
ncbi:MAG: translation initiation factor IF-2 N-terminal domain-containing protein, partial [Gordonia sp. (in: high G+C Gram-positive bacteria)]